MRPSPKFQISLLLVLQLIVLYQMKRLGLHDILDARLCYSGHELNSYLGSLQAGDGIQAAQYFRHELWDLCFILLYTFFLWTIWGIKNGIYSRLRLAVFAPGIFDLIETGSILVLLKQPDWENHFAWLGVVTFCKWLSTLAVLAILGHRFICTLRKREEA